MSRSLSTEQLAERWGRSPRWITLAARNGDIPGAWKLGHLWRFIETDIEAHELAQATSSNIFELSDRAKRSA